MPFLSGTPAKVNTIDIYGLTGSFVVPGNNVVVRFFSTFASRVPSDSGQAQLLKELKPVRERIQANELEDLDALLQRDLNDARVSSELVPYLRGNKTPVTFFPAILAVLAPQGFIQGDKPEYPTPGPEEDGVIKYGDCWILTRYSIGEEKEESPFGRLSIYPNRTDILVLDGQHRANAFRYVAGFFGDNKSDIYSAFYRDEDRIDDFDANLPVTLIWFESEDSVEPTLVSRNLFVTVNNSARKVSESRNILLNDSEVPAVTTRFFYSCTARDASFAVNKFSLLHSGFDIDTDLSSGAGHALTLTNPAIFDFAIAWFLFGTGTYDNKGSYRVRRDDSRNRTYQDRFATVFNGDFDDRNIREHIDYQERPTVVVKDAGELELFRQEFEQKLYPILRDLFNRFTFLREHYEACSEVDDWVRQEGVSAHDTVWERVFVGGEGLYYTFMGASSQLPDKVSTYQKAIREIEGEFKKRRANRIEEHDLSSVTEAYEAFRTKAFQTGCLMALRIYRDEVGEEFTDCYEDFINAMNKLSPAAWVHVLTKIKGQLIRGTDPKSWPAYQKLILRIALRGEPLSYYSKENLADAPEGRIFTSRVKDRIQAYAESENVNIEDLTLKAIAPSTIEKWSDELKHELEELFEPANLEPIDGDYRALAQSKVEEELKRG